MIPGDKSYYPGADVLINNYGIRDGALLRKMEYRLAHVREIQARLNPIPGQFDLQHLQQIHKHVFQDMYAWAGQLRQIDFAKRGADGLVSQFMPAAVLEIKGEQLAKHIAERNGLKGLSHPEFIKALAEVHTKLNELHPFREGNGRAVRVFLSQLASQAGYEIDLTKVDKDQWNHASQRAMNRIDPKKPEATPIVGMQDEVRRIFHTAVRPTMAHAFVNESKATALRFYPELSKAYARVDAIGKFVSKLPGRDPEKLMEAERARIVKKLSDGVVPPLNAYLQGRFASADQAAKLVQRLTKQKTTQSSRGRAMGRG